MIKESNKNLRRSASQKRRGGGNELRKAIPRLKKQGRITEALPSLHFRVKLDDGKEVLARLAGKLRLYRIKVLPGDKVTVELSHYDDKRGRIVYREK